MADLESILEFMVDIASQAGDVIVEMRASSKVSHNYKQGIELVTNSDLAADKLITDAIHEHFPNDQILAEESNPDLQSLRYSDSPIWVIDPIDGTVNYAHHHHQVAISIAYVVKGKIQAAVVYNPFLSEVFSAIRQKGAWLNDQPIRCSATTELNRAIIATGFPYDKSQQLNQLMHRLHKVLEQCADVRRLGSAALDICWVALGRLDAYYESVSPWDCAAGWLIAKEAGARCGYFIEPNETVTHELHSENLLIATPALYDSLKTILREAQL
ncbi:inositol monophosphatase family protein [Bermanella sp. WJH001]|uniref:inositol monophosphatase family protein n=1 Tax=Bermanella sp. WJH001 TaxID=3048005 RepID=UPI0024BD7181|nr:inositol monophosphatase family protein [Bermanella sp. WJH001]MDJ1539323.1 inositol monophosphatase family protein [Bermanella sp. WJH001]